MYQEYKDIFITDSADISQMKLVTLGIDVVFLAMVKIIPVDAYICIYCRNLSVSIYLHVCMIIYTVIVHSSGIYA